MIAGFLLFTRNHRAPIVMVTLLAARVIVPLAEEGYVCSIAETTYDARGALVLVLSACLWIPYFLRSERVKNTFVHFLFRR